MDGVSRDRVDDTLTFCRIHCDNKETHQNVLTCFADVGLTVATAGSDGGMMRVVAFMFTLAPKEQLWSLVGEP